MDIFCNSTKMVRPMNKNLEAYGHQVQSQGHMVQTFQVWKDMVQTHVCTSRDISQGVCLIETGTSSAGITFRKAPLTMIFVFNDFDLNLTWNFFTPLPRTSFSLSFCWKLGKIVILIPFFPISPRFWYPKRVTRVSRTSFLLVFMDTHDAQAPLRHNTLGDTVQY